MKKILLYTSMAVIAIVGCTKESDQLVREIQNDETQESVETNTTKRIPVEYSFVVSLSDETKATINESTGAFSWSAVGEDKIAVYDKTDKKFIEFTSSEVVGGNMRFTGEGYDDSDFEGQYAYYPSSLVTCGVEVLDPSAYTFPTSLTLATAPKSFPMRAAVSSGNISLRHLGCLIKVTFNNVPSFTTAIVLNDGAKDITVTGAPTAGVLSATIPIPAGTYVLTAKLKDDNENVFYNKARSSKTYTARDFYTINPISLDHVIKITDNSGWTSPSIKPALYIYSSADGSKNRLYTTDSGLFTLSGGAHYVLLDSNTNDWVSSGSAIGVKFQTDPYDGAKTTETSLVYLLRDLDFTVPAGGGMKTEYRLYPHGGSYANPHARAYYDDAQTVTLYVDCSAISFGTPYLHIGFGANATAWSSKADMVNEGGSVYSYTFPSSYFGTSGVVVVSNSKDADGWKSVDYTADFTSKKSYTIQLGDGSYGNPATVTQTASADFVHTEILGGAPGTAFTSPASITGADGTYISLGAALYGKGIHVVFSDNGSNPKDTWNITVNRDYDYGL